MRILLCGQRTFGKLIFEMLLERGDDIAGVFCPIKKSSDGWDRLFSVASGESGIDIMEAGTLSARTMPDGVDLIVAAHSHDYVSGAVLRKAKIGGIGYHPSLLPRHRGRDAVRWAVKAGDPITGGSVYWLDRNVDGGPIAAQDWCWIRKGDTARELWRRDLRGMGVRLMGETLSDLDGKKIVAIPQDEGVATWEPSWERPPLHRPDLLRLGAVNGYRVVKVRE